MIEAQGLYKQFRTKASLKRGRRQKKVEAVRDVSFRAENGAITGLLGANGAGKSTTLRMLATLIRPDAGRAAIDGFDVVSQAMAARSQIGFLPHNAGIYPRLTAVENIQYYARIAGLPDDEVDVRVEELVTLLDMEAFALRRTDGFSQGQRTKVALARALVHRPRTVILDEPTNGLDVMATRNLRVILRRLRDQGHCILLSSHVMQEVTALCDHVAIIDDGRIAISGSIADIQAQTGQEDFEDAFVVAIGQSLEAQG